MSRNKFIAASFCLLITIAAHAGGPGSGRHKEHFGKGDGNLFLFLLVGALVLFVVFFIVAIIKGISNGIKQRKAQKEFLEKTDLLLKKGELNHEEWSAIRKQTAEKGLVPGTKQLDAVNERRKREKEIAEFILRGDQQAEQDEISKEGWHGIKTKLLPHFLLQAQKELKELGEKRRKEKAIELFLKDNAELATSGIIIAQHWEAIRQRIYSEGPGWAEWALNEANRMQIRYDEMIGKHGQEKGRRIFNKEFFVGMTQSELRDSAGEPTKIEYEVLKTKTKEIWIYGNKSSGDVFVFENSILTRFKDR